MENSRINEQLARDALGIFGAHGTSIVVDFSAAVATSASALTAGETYRFCATEDCHVCTTTTGADDATNVDTLIGAFAPENFRVPKDLAAANSFISAIKDTVGGKLFIDLLISDPV